MRILVFGINHAPEPTGIGKYTGEMVAWFAARGHDVRVLTAMPYYPWWRKPHGYRRWWYLRERHGGARVLRCPLYVPHPNRVTSLRRMVHELTFTMSALMPWLGVLLSPRRPDVIIALIPATQSAMLPVLFGRIRRVPVVVHAQDLQVDAAIQLGMLKPRALGTFMSWVERFVLTRATEVTTISDAMRSRIIAKGVDADRVHLFPNWADPTVVPMDRDNEVRDELGAGPEDVLVLYAGTLGEKQGLEMLLDAAAHLADQPRIRFVIAGSGSSRQRLIDDAHERGLDAVQFIDSQPVKRLPAMLASADIHVVLQRTSAADLVLPSKLTNILASGRPSIVTAADGSTLADTLHATGAGRTCELEGVAIAEAIALLASDRDTRRAMGEAGARYAEAHLSASAILSAFEELTSNTMTRGMSVRHLPFA